MIPKECEREKVIYGLPEADVGCSLHTLISKFTHISSAYLNTY